MNLLQQFEEYRQLGCTDRNKCAVAHRCITALRSGTANATVHCRYDAELQLLYALVQPNDVEAAPYVYVPLATSINIDMIEMSRVQQRLGQLHPNLASISMAMVDANGTTIYYRLTAGLK